MITDERKRLERQRIEEERLNAPNGSAVSAAESNDTGVPGVGSAAGQPSVDIEKGNVPTGPLPEIERGLCVVCQDEEATLAVVDCG